MLLLQALPGLQAWNGPAWSISAEAFAYLVFPLIALTLRRIGNRWTSATLAATWLTGGTALMMFALTLSDSPTSPGLILLRITTEFTAGCFLWKFWSQSARPQSLRWDGITLIVTVAVIVLLGEVGVSEGRPLLLTPLMALFVLGCASASGPVARVLSTKAMKQGYMTWSHNSCVVILSGSSTCCMTLRELSCGRCSAAFLPGCGARGW